jgi:hypothetical protein
MGYGVKNHLILPYADPLKVEIELERPRIIDGAGRNRRGIGG